MYFYLHRDRPQQISTCASRMKHALVKVVGGVVGATLLGDATIRMLSSVSSVSRLQTLSVLMLVLCQVLHSLHAAF